MQTFMPYSSYTKSLACLDMKRLGKQRVESWQIFKLITGQAHNKWARHPATKMWLNHDHALALYYNTNLHIFQKKGGINKKLKPIVITKNKYKEILKEPSWSNNPRVILSHRASLLRKNYFHYSQFGWSEEFLDSPYYWPTGLACSNKNLEMIAYWSQFTNEYLNHAVKIENTHMLEILKALAIL